MLVRMQSIVLLFERFTVAVAARGFLAPGSIDHFGAPPLPLEVKALEVGSLEPSQGGLGVP